MSDEMTIHLKKTPLIMSFLQTCIPNNIHACIVCTFFDDNTINIGANIRHFLSSFCLH